MEGLIRSLELGSIVRIRIRIYYELDRTFSQSGEDYHSNERRS